jgi:hypothetical protein
MFMLTTFPLFVWIGAQPFFFEMFQHKIQDVKQVRAYIFASELGRLVIKNLPTFFMVLSYIMLNSRGSEANGVKIRPRHLRRNHGMINPGLFQDPTEEFMEPDAWANANRTSNLTGNSTAGVDPDSFVESMTYLIWFISSSFL